MLATERFKNIGRSGLLAFLPQLKIFFNNYTGSKILLQTSVVQRIYPVEFYLLSLQKANEILPIKFELA